MSFFVGSTCFPEAFHPETPEREVAAFVDKVRELPAQRDALVALLPEQHPLYSNRSTNQVNRIRGYVLASFESTGLPPSALVYVLQELENGRDAYLVAAAARAIRGMTTPTGQVVPYLLKAISSIRHMDDAVSFAHYAAVLPLEQYTTASSEILLTLRWLGAYARAAIKPLEQLLDNDGGYVAAGMKLQIKETLQGIREDTREINTGCCITHWENPVEEHHGTAPIADVLQTVLEDEEGQKIAYGDFFRGRFSIVSFFYTRCNNPNKCSLTITKLVQLRKALEAEGIGEVLKMAAITYDPGYDLPARLKIYGENRGYRFDEKNRMFRVEWEKYQALKGHFNLGVSYAGAIVNQHRIELYVLNKEGAILRAFTHLQWDLNEVVGAIKELLQDERLTTLQKPRIYKKVSSIWAVVLPIIIAFFPKCAFCWAAYLSAFGVTSLNAVSFNPWMLPILVTIVFINLIALFVGAKQRNGLRPFYISLVGAIFLLVLGRLNHVSLGVYLGVVLLMLGSFLNSLPFIIYLKLIQRLSAFFKIPSD